MGVGYIGLGILRFATFYTSLGLIIVGNGFLNLRFLPFRGNLYSEPEYKDKKDTGYNIFYMGINIGALFVILLRHL